MPARRRTPFRPRFQRTAQIAETATSGVAVHMDAGDILIAVPLQTVAALAWGAAADSTALPALRTAVHEALAALDDVTGAGAARGFLEAAAEYLDSVLAESADTATDSLSLF